MKGEKMKKKNESFAICIIIEVFVIEWGKSFINITNKVVFQSEFLF